jgi:predicted enzyme related to lactoylglutathione lyase
MILGSVNHIDLTVSDMARAAGFYKALLVAHTPGFPA